MTIQDYLSKMKRIQESILKYIDEDSCQVINLAHLMRLLNDLNIRGNQYELGSVLHLLVNVANNHHRGVDFFEKIEKLLKKLKNEIKQYFSNRSIFDIFKSNKRILLFLIENEILIMDKIIASIITKPNTYEYTGYPEYFYKQIKLFISKEVNESLSRVLSLTYEIKQRIGENDDDICELIRGDLINDFISYVKKKNVSLSGSIHSSYFETNSFLIEKNPSLIEYASFFGSTKIFKYLHENNVELKPSLWLYSIHGRSPEIIHYLNNNHVELEDKTYKECIRESIKCHHSDILNLIQNIYLKNIDESETLIQCFEFYNFDLVKTDSINQSFFYYLCKYDCYPLVEILLGNINENINRVIIYN